MDTPNTPPQIRRVRRVGSEWHVSYSDGRPAMTVPCVNTGRYQSRVSYEFVGGRLATRAVER